MPGQQPRRHVWRCAWLPPTALALGLTGSTLVQAGEVIQATVDYAEGRFTLHTDVLIQTPASQVRAILTHYENLPNVNSGIKSVTLLAHPGAGQTRMQVQAQLCILLICLHYQWVQEARILPSGDIVTEFDPQAGDFREGWVRYQLLPEGEHTHLIMDARLTPNFWFPPLIGPLLIKSKLRQEALKTVLGVEQLARRETNPQTGKDSSALHPSPPVR
jgi:hypothetical protein